jgi:HlyD family secretion protein
MTSTFTNTREVVAASMDRPRPKRRFASGRRIALALGIGGLILLVSLGLAYLKPAPPTVERSTVWIDAVKRGEMVRQVKGMGTLVPEAVRLIPAASEARVERMLVQPGARVEPETVLLELSNPELELAAMEAESRSRAAQARLVEVNVRLESQRTDQLAVALRAKSDYQQARLKAEADEALAKQGLVAALTVKLSRTTADELEQRQLLEQSRLEKFGASVSAQRSVQVAEIDQAAGLARLRRSQFEALRVRAGIAGVLQQMPLEVGQSVVAGTILAKVAEAERLKAVVKVPETQARDIQAGQKATIDTRNGIVSGRVIRVDPAVQNGTVTVDVALEGSLPKGARPDLAVDGTIELERLADVLHVGRPAQAVAGATLGLFRLEPDGSTAVRVPVKLGRSSVSAVEVVEGLVEGDRVILSDASAWDRFDRIRLK